MKGELITVENFEPIPNVEHSIPIFDILSYGKYRTINLKSTGRILYGILYSYLHSSKEKGYINSNKDNALYVKEKQVDIAKEISVSINTLRKYLNLLEQLDLIEIEKKGSIFVDEIYLRYPVREGLSEKEEAFLRAEELGLDFPDID